jgi:FkbM family methyltransferase
VHTSLTFLRSLLPLIPAGLPGKTRLARFLLGRKRAAQDVEVTCFDGSRMLIPSLSDSVGFHLFIDGVYERTELKWLLRELQPGDVFVDVGANIGGFTLPAAGRVGALGLVVAVEASPRIADYLRRNLETNRVVNVRVCQVAVSDQTSNCVTFYAAPDQSFGAGGLGAGDGMRPITVGAKRLDHLLAEQGVTTVRVLKVDVEGFEAAVFRGAEQLLTGSNPPAVLFEFYEWAERRSGTPGDAQRVLREWGYDIWRIEDYVSGHPPMSACLTREPGGNLIALRSDCH